MKLRKIFCILYFKYNDVVDELFPYNIPLNEEGKYFHF